MYRKPQYQVRDLLWLTLVVVLGVTIYCLRNTNSHLRHQLSDSHTEYSRIDKEYRVLYNRYVEMADVFRDEKFRLLRQIELSHVSRNEHR